MYIIKNSLNNLVRNRGRNLIVLFVVFLTLTSVTLSFAIQNVSDSAIQQYKGQFHIDATIDYDWDKLEKDFPPIETVNDDGSVTQESSFDLPEISLEEYLQYAKSNYLKKTQFFVGVQFASDTLTKVPDNLHTDESFIDLNGMTLDELKEFFNVKTRKEIADELGGEEALKQTLDMKRNCVGFIQGYTDLSLVDEFSSGENKLKEGKFPEKDNECVISTKYAEQNKLKIGDTIDISGPSKSDKETIHLIITGLYSASRSEASAVTLGDAYGYVYTTFETVVNSGFHWQYVNKVIFEVKDLESAKLFEKELHQKGLSEYGLLSYSNSSEEYIKNTEPLKNISHIAEIFTFCSGIIGTAIIMLIICLNIRERKYEIAVLRSMGMKKSAIAKGLIYEILMIVITGFGLSVLAVTILEKPIAGILIGDLGTANIGLSVAVLLCAFVAISLSIVCGTCSVFMVMRHEPMKILVERN